MLAQISNKPQKSTQDDKHKATATIDAGVTAPSV